MGDMTRWDDFTRANWDGRDAYLAYGQRSHGMGVCTNASYRVDDTRFKCSSCGRGGWWKDAADGRDKLPRYCPNCGRLVVSR